MTGEGGFIMGVNKSEQFSRNNFFEQYGGGVNTFSGQSFTFYLISDIFGVNLIILCAILVIFFQGE